MNFVSYVAQRTSAFTDAISKTERKRYGQFFTSASIAEFMASKFNIDPRRPVYRILDAGAGAGILSAAVVERFRQLNYAGKLELTCYETDKNILPLLHQNLKEISAHINLAYRIVEANYITSQMWPISNPEYDLIIGNPPYKKISKDADEAKYMHEVCYGAPNLYFLFWAMAVHNLKKDGELIYIVPRSWTSGAYFEKFREFLFANCTISDIHLFESRDKIFDGESVLQETMIIKVAKSVQKRAYIRMSRSSTSDFADLAELDVDYNVVVTPEKCVFPVFSQEDLNILETINTQKNTLPSNKLPMRTGLIVDFRTWNDLRDHAENDYTYPLFYSQNIKNGRIIWPTGGKKPEYICTNRKGYLQENTNYLFIKRFTSKEENRRLQCGVYLSTDFPNYKYISTQNKLNYIKCPTPDEAFGLYVIFNSTLYDKYYRILNGSTQVNSTEINRMPVPPKNTIIAMGKEIQGLSLSEENCNKILKKWIKKTS